MCYVSPQHGRHTSTDWQLLAMQPCCLHGKQAINGLAGLFCSLLQKLRAALQLAKNLGQGTAQHSTAQHSTAQHSTAQHSTAQPTQGLLCCLQVYKALNSMGETAWGINPRILEQVQHAYKDLKGGFCGLPLHESVEDAPLPPPPSRVFRIDAYRGQLSARVSYLATVNVLVRDQYQVTLVGTTARGALTAGDGRKSHRSGLDEFLSIVQGHVHCWMTSGSCLVLQRQKLL